jgi:ligand-binding sensor domain-containing protein/signal transduction histidine kinase
MKLLMFLACAELVYALDPRTPITQYQLTVWGKADGLADHFVQAIEETQNGYLWLGTQEGLARFDGSRFQNFDTKNTPLLKHNSIVTLREDQKGVLWIGTSGGGITQHDGHRFVNSYTTANGLPNNYLRDIYEDKAGNLWLTAHDGGLVRYRDGQFHALTKRDGLTTNSLRTVLADRNGKLWIGTNEDGLSVLDNGAMRHVGSPVGIQHDQVRVLFEDSKGRIWVGTRSGGLYLHEEGKFRVFTRRDGLPSNSIRAIVEDRQGNLWIGTENGGLARYRDGVFATVGTKEGLPHNFVRSLYEDRDGNLWVGTRAGLCRLRDRRVATLTTADGLAHDSVRTLMEDAQGRMWIGTAMGLNVLSNGRVRAARLSGDGAKDNLRAVAQGRDGRIWFGEEHGLYEWREGAVRRFGVREGLPDATVRAIVEDTSGSIWAGTTNGLYRMSGAVFEPVATNDEGKAEEIRGLAADGRGVVWVGTGEGLVRLEDGRRKRFLEGQGLANNSVMCLYLGSGSTLWIGTRGGLTMLRDGKMKSVTRRDGLLSDNVYGVVEDDFGNVWLSSARGVSRIARRELGDFAAGQVREVRPVSFDRSDGMKSSECNGHAQPAAWKGKDGRLWFPTIQGLVGFDPQEEPRTLRAPKVLVEGARSGKREVWDGGGEVALPPGGGDLEIRFTAIRLSAPDRLRFRYLLEGYDQEWVEAGERRSAFYTNLPPGDFVFRVAAHESGGPSLGEARAMVRIEPRFYQSRWFLPLALGMAGVLAMLGYRLRMAFVHQRYELVLAERARIAREVHDTLMQGVTGIALQLEVASQKVLESPAAAKEGIERSLVRLDGVLAEARQCVLELRQPEGVQGDLGRALETMTRELADGHEVKATVEIQGRARKLSPKIETELLRIAREAITNALVHADANHVVVTLRFEGKGVRLMTVDDGLGFDVNRVPASHFGLRGMKERAQQIGGEWTVESTPGKGTAVGVTVGTA